MKSLVRKILPQWVINNFYHLPEAILANLIYRFPSWRLTVIGVTGTDGKTTTTNMIYQILKNAGKKVSMVSTVNSVIGGKAHDIGFHVTSPDPFAVQKFARKALDFGDEYLILEVTSHGLDQYRFWGTKFDVGVITNITHEHLDYHKTWEKYFQAKARLIKDIKVAVLNKDEQHFDKLVRLTHGMCKVISFGLSEEAEFNPKKFSLNLKIPGEYNLLNALAASAATKSLGVDTKKIRQALENFQSLPGRMQEVPNKLGIKIIIDFAHTPNGLEQALKTLDTQRAWKQTKNPGFRYNSTSEVGYRKLIAITGAEGFRDIEKRPLMGEIAVRLADCVIITAVDPRGQLEDINQQILKGTQKAGGKLGKNLFVIDDRAKAIDFAINKLAKKGDSVAIFGKGHETSMNLDGKKEIPWSDEEAVKEVLKKNH